MNGLICAMYGSYHIHNRISNELQHLYCIVFSLTFKPVKDDRLAKDCRDFVVSLSVLLAISDGCSLVRLNILGFNSAGPRRRRNKKALK